MVEVIQHACSAHGKCGNGCGGGVPWGGCWEGTFALLRVQTLGIIHPQAPVNSVIRSAFCMRVRQAAGRTESHMAGSRGTRHSNPLLFNDPTH